MENYFFMLMSVVLFLYGLAVILLTALKWDWFSNHPELYPWQRKWKLEREAYGTYSGTYLVNGIKGVRRAVFIKAGIVLIFSVVLIVAFTGRILEERAEEKARIQQAADLDQTGESVAGGATSSSQSSASQDVAEEPEIAFGVPIDINNLSLVLERAEFLPAISTGRFDKNQDSELLTGEEDGSVLLTVMGTFTNKSDRNLELDTQKISVSGVWADESVTEGYMAANSHMTDESTLVLSPDKCAVVYFFLSVPGDLATSFADTGVPEFQLKIRNRTITISKEVLNQALEEALEVNPKQGSYAEESRYVNETLGFTYIVPEGWRMSVKSEEEENDPFRLMEAIQPETGEYLTIDAIPIVFLEGRSLEKFISNYQDIYYYRLESMNSDMDVSVNVINDGSFVQELEGGTVTWGKLEMDVWNDDWDEDWDDDWGEEDILDVYIGAFQRGDYLLLIDQYFLRSGYAADPIEIGEPVEFHE